ncbi:hypothetical protein V1477_014761 [Vespula maculifrons]|uniref:Uncharacterized protein n=1 Tax=Vespula maculifrons TaxID=7453 RepID=A0ABD2BIP5_VESMC
MSSDETRLTSIVVSPTTKKDNPTDSNVHSSHFLELILCLDAILQKPLLIPPALPVPSPPLSYVYPTVARSVTSERYHLGKQHKDHNHHNRKLPKRNIR